MEDDTKNGFNMVKVFYENKRHSTELAFYLQITLQCKC